MRNQDVVRKFMEREPASGSNLYSSGDRLFSYNTCIGEWRDNTILVNYTKYSRSTSKHQFYLRTQAVTAYDIARVNEIIPMYNIPINQQILWQTT